MPVSHTTAGGRLDDKEQLKVEERGADVRTFLIADVRGYTRFTQEQGDEAAGALAARFAKIAGAAVTDLGGELLELRGDEALAVFSSARGALRAAVELQKRLRTPTESDPPLALGVGIGLDSGEAVPIEGGYRGGALNLAARLCAIAEPGQILASETVVSLARRVDGLRFATRRAVRLKGLAEPVRMVEIAPEKPLPPLPQPPSKKAHPARPGFRALLAGAMVTVALGAVAFNRFAGPVGLGGVPANSVGIIDASSGAIASRLPLQGRPGGVAVGAGSVWVTDEVAGTLLRVDPVEQIVVDTIPVGDGPAGVAVGAGAVWVANSESHTVSQINPDSGTVVATIPVGNGPISVAVGVGAVWVANATDGTIARIDPARGRTVATVPLPQPPSGLAAEGQEVWATSAQGGLVSKVDPATNTVSQTLLVGNGPTGIALGAGAVWVSNGPDKTVSRIDESGEITKINVSGMPETLAFGDRAGIVEAWGGKQLAQPTCQVLPPGLPGYRPYCPYTKHATTTGTWSGPDIDRAKELVRASGTSGKNVTVYTLKGNRLAAARLVAATLVQLGYRGRIKAISDFNKFYSLVGRGATRAQIGMQGWIADYPVASNFFPFLLSCDSYQPRGDFNLNTAAFCSRRIDRLINRATAAQAGAPSTAAQLWQRVDRAVVDEAPWLPLINERGIDLISERVGNYQRNPQLGMLLDQLWVE